MCEFCHKHGEGKKWYLKAGHYSDDLVSDLRRRGFIEDFLKLPERIPEQTKQMARLEKLPGFVKRAVRGRVSESMKATHFGQILPIEDVERIFDFVTSIVRLPCVCRHIMVGSEQRYCYGVSLAPDGGKYFRLIRDIDAAYLTGPDTSGLEPLTKEQALAAFREHEKQGLCHSVWTFVAPFIGGICNCDRTDCLALKTQLNAMIPTLFRAETVALVEPDLCNGCRECLRLCPFGAMCFSPARRKVSVEARQCFGCGVCRSACAKNAIFLSERSSSSVAKDLWT
ncbi:MAG: 4Fe-4S ferredoxin [Candidatus Aminicenantes bacterium]|nr:4Fe-4S ferredoxin [Candidatus Aminicenantes bacterium]